MPTPGSTNHWASDSSGAGHRLYVALTYVDRNSMDLYRVDQARHATAVLHFQVDEPADEIDSVTVSSGEHPAVCMVVGLGAQNYRLVTRCLNAGGPLPSPPTYINVDFLQLSPDGTRLLVTDLATRRSHLMHELLLEAGAWREVRTLDLAPFDKARPGCDVQRIDRRDATVVVFCRRPSGEGEVFTEPFEQLVNGRPSLKEQPLTPKGGASRGFDRLDSVTLLDGSHAFGAISSSACDDTPCSGEAGSRLVLLDPRSGAVQQVIGRPLKGRQLTQASGDANGIAYMTEGDGYVDQRLYVRWPGEPRGVRVTGVPTDFEWMFAEG